MARTKPRIRTQQGRVLTGSCTQKQASEFLTRRKVALNDMIDGLTAKQFHAYSKLTVADKHLFETRHGVPARDGNCTFQSAEYVLRFGAGTPFYTEMGTRAKAKREPRERAQKPRDPLGWWMALPGERGFDNRTGAR